MTKKWYERFLVFILALVLVLTLTGCGDDEEPAAEDNKTSVETTAGSEEKPATAENAPEKESESWAIYWYLCGSDLESQNGCATADLIEALSVKLPENVTVVIETGGAGAWMNELVDPSVLQRWIIRDQELVLVDEQPSASMGEASTLADFLSFSYANYPADRIGVTFWNHGGGSTSGAAFDEIYGYDFLDQEELYSAFTSVWPASAENPPIELVGFDTCLMANIDTAYTLSDIAHYLVASEETEPGNGWYYTGWLEKLAADPSMDGAELGKIICDAYAMGCEMVGTGDEITLSVTDLTKIPKLIEAYESFGEEALVASTNDDGFLAKFARAAVKSENYGGNTKEQGYADMLDIGHLARLTEDMLPSAGAVLEGLDDCVIYRVAGPYRSESTGLSGYYTYDYDIGNLNGYIDNGAGAAFKYLYAYEITGEMIDGCEEYLNSLEIEQLPDRTTLEDYGFEGVMPDISENGSSVISLGPDAQNILSDVEFSLLYMDAEDDFMWFLGSDNDIYYDWENGIFEDNFRGVWISLNGMPLLTEIAFAGDEYTLYSSPIKLNGEDYILQFVYDYSAASYEIIGATKEIDENGMGSKDLRLLQEGDEITILWMASTFNGDGEMQEFEADTITVDSSLTIGEAELIDGNYFLCYSMYDIYGNDAMSEGVLITMEDGIITTSILE